MHPRRPWQQPVNSCPPGGARRPTCTRLLENQARQGRPRDVVCSCQPELWAATGHSRILGLQGRQGVMNEEEKELWRNYHTALGTATCHTAGTRPATRMGKCPQLTHGNGGIL